jgi:hypothetical protein
VLDPDAAPVAGATPRHSRGRRPPATRGGAFPCSRDEERRRPRPLLAFPRCRPALHGDGDRRGPGLAPAVEGGVESRRAPRGRCAWSSAAGACWWRPRARQRRGPGARARVTAAGGRRRRRGPAFSPPPRRRAGRLRPALAAGQYALCGRGGRLRAPPRSTCRWRPAPAGHPPRAGGRHLRTRDPRGHARAGGRGARSGRSRRRRRTLEPAVESDGDGRFAWRASAWASSCAGRGAGCGTRRPRGDRASQGGSRSSRSRCGRAVIAGRVLDHDGRRAAGFG